MSLIEQESPSLAELYRSLVVSYDETLEKSGEFKPAWAQLLTNLQRLGLPQLEARHQEIIRQLKENGVTYNVYDDPQGLSRAWQIDPIPLLIEEQEWQTISAGLKQRAELLNLMLLDLFGERRLIRDKVLPPELIYRHSGFLRECQQLRIPGDYQLVIHAADLARGPDGRIWVLSDRTQAPSGMGYALENRSVVSNILPDLYEHIHVLPVAEFLSHFHESILKILPHAKEDPFIVYLTPGPNNETYFEHSYLSSYLGYTLVQGSDLVARDGYVWLRCIDRLQKVDVIIRRIDDLYCDPLEFNETSMLGVAGLIDVMRRGNVTVVNPPGCSLLENRGLFAFMNAASQYLLQEDLKLPTMATWWCGQPKELSFVLDNLDKLVIKKIDRSDHFKRVYGKELSKKALDELKRQIKATPFEFVGHEDVSFSAVPSLTENGIDSRMAAVRCFAMAGKGGYQVMPGGLSRRSVDKESFSVSNRYGGISKDTWVVSGHDPERHSLSLSTSMFSNKEVSLPSRSAENLFWLARMTDRGIATANFIHIVLEVMNEYSRTAVAEEDPALQELLKALTHLTGSYPGFLDDDDEAPVLHPLDEIRALVGDPRKLGSITFSLGALFNSAISVRDHLSLESWRVMDLIKEAQEQLQVAIDAESLIFNIQQKLREIITLLFTFYGTVTETMPQHAGKLLFKIGKIIERILNSIAIIRSVLTFQQPGTAQHTLFEAALVYHNSLTNYRLRYRSSMELRYVLDTLLFSSSLPYSLSYQLQKLSKHLDALPSPLKKGRLNAAQKLVLSSITTLQLSDLENLTEKNRETGFYENLDAMLHTLGESISQLSITLTEMYFNHTLEQHSFSQLFNDPPRK
ncbi:Uncharacterized conserved protein, circularly permuted ATPgrasp superfamily [Catalinimonas alkaloidigena]|uniref:Uncharacterized conserved protein, circularly permuted ATPgrasp superfamily n=2 Tax=Catalinimonas alkaloidigena TaxID=1075417 RepID=A0A1G9GBP2_9BACT|nr:Uncharacterized conserved protein, circularly permuted ATPgrasp superfamily [Catalinimonas alkaloidigena]